MNDQHSEDEHIGDQVRSLRLKRGWSQSHLAALSSLGERTIQRVESSGQASLESRMAIAQALDLTPAQLFQCQTPDGVRMSSTRRLGLRLASGLGLLSSMAVLLALTFGPNPSTAEPLQLEVALTREDKVSTVEHALNTETIHQSLEIAEGLRLDINTATRSEQTLISMGLYRVDQPGQPITTPSLVMANGKDAAIEIGLESGDTLRLTFRYPDSVENPTP